MVYYDILKGRKSSGNPGHAFTPMAKVILCIWLDQLSVLFKLSETITPYASFPYMAILCYCQHVTKISYQSVEYSA